MRILIAEDDIVSRMFMQKFLSKFGECDVAVDGLETVDSYKKAINENNPYDFICLDIMMPKIDGLRALKTTREIEKETGIDMDKRVHIIMTTALNDKEVVMNAYDTGCEAYAWKPIDTNKFITVMERFGLISKLNR